MSRVLYFTALSVVAIVLLSRAHFIWSHGSHGDSENAQKNPALIKQSGSTVIAIHFDAWQDWRDAYKNLLIIPESIYVNRVAVSAGRADWTYFRWPGNESWWSSEQTATDTDMLEHTLAILRQRGYRTTAIIDVFGERYLTRYPDAAAIDLDGNRSKYVICSTELAKGEAGNHLVNAVEALATGTQADTVAVTELFYDKHCYDDRCLLAFKKTTGLADWPRNSSGRIDYFNPMIGQWRSKQVASIVARLSQAVHAHDKRLALDVKISRGNLSRNSVENGQDYDLLAPYVDEFVVWDYFATEGESPESAGPVAAYFNEKFGASKYYLSVGLWGRSVNISGDELARALRSAQEGGAANLWVTPAEHMTTLHWKALADVVHAANISTDETQSQQ